MKKTYWKMVCRAVTKSFSRFIAIFAITALGVGFLTGLVCTAPDMKRSADRYYDESHFMDIDIKSTMGLTEDDLSAVQELESVETATPSYQEDVLLQTGEGETSAVRLIGLDFSELTEESVNQPELLSGRLPEKEGECVQIVSSPFTASVAVGDTLTIEAEEKSDAGDDEEKDEDDEDEDEEVLRTTELTVVGLVRSPLYMSTERESTSIGTGTLSMMFYVDMDQFDTEIYTDFFITLKDGASRQSFSEDYRDYVDEEQEVLEALGDEREQTRYDEIREEAESELADGEEEYQEERADAESELADAREELDDASEELADAKEELADAKEEIDDGEQTLKENKEKLDDAGEELASAKKKLDSAKKQLDEAAPQIEEAKKTIEENQDQIEEAREAVETYDKSLAEYEDGVKSLAAARKQLDEGQETYETGQKEYEEQKAEAEKTFAATEKSLSEAAEQIEEGEKQLAQQKETLQTSQKQLDAVSSDMEALRQLIESGASVTEEQQQALNTYDENRKALEEGWEALEKAEEELESSKSSYETGKKEYEEGKAEAEKTFAATEKELAAAAEELEEGEKEYAESKKTLEAAKKQLDASAEEIETARKSVEEWDEAYPEMKEAIETYEKSLKEYEEGLAEYEAGKKEYEEGLAAYEEGVAEWEDGRTEYEDGLSEYEDGKKEYEDGLEDYEEASAEAEEEFADAEEELDDARAEIEDLDYPEWYVLDRDTNMSFASFDTNADKLASLSKVFPIFFFLVAALVALTTMTRMVEEERTEIGTMKALGIGSGAIACKYLIYAGAAAILGSIFGILVGQWGLPAVIWNAYKITYYYPDFRAEFLPQYALPAAAAAIASVLLATWSAVKGSLRECSARLMLPKAPKEGRRILLEHVTPVWKRMAFTHKVTARNLFRYKKRFFMTVVGVAGCTALLVAGFGIRDSVSHIVDIQYSELQKYNLTVVFDDDAAEEEREAALAVIEERNEATLTIHSETGNVIANDQTESTYIQIPSDAASFPEFLDLRKRTTGEAVAFDERSVIMTEKMASILSLSVGDTFTLEDADEKRWEFTLTGITENYIRGYVYIGSEIWQETTGYTPEWETCLVRSTASGEDEENAETSALLALDGVSSAQFSSSIMSTFDNLISKIDYVVIVLILFAGMLAFIVLYNLTNINISEREKEIATLRVLGFRQREANAYIARETVILSLFGAAAGLVLGFILHRFVILTVEFAAIMFGRKIYPVSYLYAVCITMLFTALVNLVMTRRIRRISMVESMKSVD